MVGQDGEEKQEKFDQFDFDAAGEARGYISLARVAAMSVLSSGLYLF